MGYGLCVDEYSLKSGDFFVIRRGIPAMVNVINHPKWLFIDGIKHMKPLCVALFNTEEAAEKFILIRIESNN